MLGFGLGALIRHTAGALSAFFGILFATTALVDLLPTTWRNHVINYMPANAGSQIITVVPTRYALPPWTDWRSYGLRRRRPHRRRDTRDRSRRLAATSPGRGTGMRNRDADGDRAPAAASDPSAGRRCTPAAMGHPFASVRSMKYVVWYAVVAERAPDLPLVNHGTRHISIR